MLPNYTLNALNESESLIDRSLMPGKLQPIYSQRMLEELPDNSGNNSSSEGSAVSFEVEEHDDLVVVSEDLHSNHKEINQLLEKLENKEIEIQNEIDNEIVIQLIDFIKILQKDLDNYADKYCNLEIDKTELETNYYQLKIHLSQLQSENEIQRDIVNEQKIDLEDQIHNITKAKSIELGQIQHSINHETRELERIESEIQIKSQILDELNDGYLSASVDKKDKEKGVRFATEEINKSDRNISSEDNEMDLTRTLSRTNDLLNAKLIEKDLLIKDQDLTINKQIIMITELTNDLREFETITKQLHDQLNNETHNIEDLKQELEIKEKQLRKRGIERQESLSRITIKIEPHKPSGVSSPVSRDSHASNFHANSFHFDSSVVTPMAVRNGTRRSDGTGGYSPASTVRSGYHTLRNFNYPGTNAPSIYGDDQDMNELNEYLDELEKLRQDNLVMNQKLLDVTNSKTKLLKENKSLKEEVLILENKLETIKNEFIQTDAKINNLNTQLKSLLQQQKVVKEEKSKSRGRSMQNVKDDYKNEKIGADRCVLFGAQFW